MNDASIMLYCTSVQVVVTKDTDPPMSAVLADIDYDDILNQVPIAEAVRYYGAHNLLTNMETKDIKDYLQP
jgi:hypothetical protein